MNEFSHDFIFGIPARRVFNELSASDQAEVTVLIERICRHPIPDGTFIHDISVPPVSLWLADDENWTIVFNVVPSFVVQILGIIPSPLRGIEG